MARFPTREADVAALAGTIAFGLAEHAEDFPDCPVGVEVLQEALARYNRAKEIAASAQGAAAEAFEEKEDAVSVSAYRVFSRTSGETEWKQLVLSFESMTVLTDQPQGVDLEFQVIAINRAGESPPSNLLTVNL